MSTSSHHISNNTATTTTSNNVTLTQVKADIVAIKAKTDQITITNPANISTMESGIATNVNGIDGILNHSIDSNLKAFVDANSNKTGITTSQANAITANTAKTGITTTQANNITTNNAKIGITTIQASIITQNSNKLNMAVASTMKNAVDANTNRYPQFTNFKRYHNQGGDIYNDGKIKFAWNATNRQLQFYVLDIPSGEYMVGGVQKWTTTSSTRVANYISQSNSSYYHYFTGPQLSGAVLNSSFNLSAHYTRATYFLHPYNEFAYPSYEITILVGYSQGYHQFSIKKFSN